MVVLHLQVIFLKVFKELQEPEFLSPLAPPCSTFGFLGSGDHLCSSWLERGTDLENHGQEV